MGNALEKASRTAVATTGNVDPFAAAAQDMAGSSAIYMKFNGNNGEFTIGQEADEVPEGTKLAVDMMNFKQGWICWKDSEVVEEIMLRVADGKRPPEEHELTDHGPYIQNEEQNDGWSRQASVTLRNLTSGEEYTFKTSSKSAYRGLGNLLKDFSRQYKFHAGEIAIVEIGSQQFEVKNKKWGKKYAPTLKIVDWVKEDDLVKKLEGDAAEDYDDAPAPQTGGAAALPPPKQEAKKEEPQQAPPPKKEAAPPKAEATEQAAAQPAETQQAEAEGDKPRPRVRRRTF